MSSSGFTNFEVTESFEDAGDYLAEQCTNLVFKEIEIEPDAAPVLSPKTDKNHDNSSSDSGNLEGEVDADPIVDAEPIKGVVSPATIYPTTPDRKSNSVCSGTSSPAARPPASLIPPLSGLESKIENKACSIENSLITDAEYFRKNSTPDILFNCGPLARWRLETHLLKRIEEVQQLFFDLQRDKTFILKQNKYFNALKILNKAVREVKQDVSFPVPSTYYTALASLYHFAGCCYAGVATLGSCPDRQLIESAKAFWKAVDFNLKKYERWNSSYSEKMEVTRFRAQIPMALKLLNDDPHNFESILPQFSCFNTHDANKDKRKIRLENARNFRSPIHHHSIPRSLLAARSEQVASVVSMTLTLASVQSRQFVYHL